jgi:3-oxoacyl-[acyl-carrier-protein] synthase-1
MQAASLPVLHLAQMTLTTCIGTGKQANWQAITDQRTGLKYCDFETVHLDTWIGEVEGLDAVRLPENLAQFDCRNNRLAQLALEQDDFVPAVYALVAQFGPHRVGVFLGTSTSGILHTELAYRRRDPHTGALPSDFLYASTQNTFSVADFVRSSLGLQGPALTVSSACSSGAKVFGVAQRHIACGLIDAAIVGGVDSLCLTTLYGFASLELTSSKPCQPFGRGRNGISVAEAAGFVLLTRSSPEIDADAPVLLSVGESSDAHHMSSPHPQGRGAQAAMQAALKHAKLNADCIDYINLHGTATISNDAAEDQAVVAVFGNTTACSSTKGATGHTLGAAGSIEAIITALCLQKDLIAGGLNTIERDPALHTNYVLSNRKQPLSYAMSNSFGFGGSNCSLIFGKAGNLVDVEQ